MDTYRVRLKRGNEDHAAYEIGGISAETPDEASEHAKMYVAENGYWPRLMSIKRRINNLSVVDIVIDR